MVEAMTEEKAIELCKDGGLDCSQLVFAHGCALMGLLDDETAHKIGACFGGGMMNGETCGCVTGALMAIGLKEGHGNFGEFEAKEKVFELKAEFEEEFKDKFGSLICRELLGYDLSKQEELEYVLSSDVLWQKCPGYIKTACDILEDIL